MYDQSFNLNSLARELRKNDFIVLKQLRDPHHKEEQIARAVQRASTGFMGHALLGRSLLKGKAVYFIKDFSDELVLRKISRNILRAINVSYPNRDQLVANIKTLISEGLAYRVYRLDLKSFYESIEISSAINVISTCTQLSIPTKRFVTEILEHHRSLGYPGLPRGIGLSAVLSELVMRDCDKKISQMAGVFYYGRFVDDIIIITNRVEDEKTFLRSIKNAIPKGHQLNGNKQKICLASKNVKPTVPPASVIDFDYLGYKFNVHEPMPILKKKDGTYFRDVWLDIAESKVKKIKTRIVRSIIAFNNDGNYFLLELRLKYLTSNFSVPDAQRQQKRLAGIYHNYWLIDPARSASLKELDLFLQNSIRSGHGKIFGIFFSKTTDAQRRRLLSHSFTRGFNKRTYLHFPKETLLEIQRCWHYA